MSQQGEYAVLHGQAQSAAKAKDYQRAADLFLKMTRKNTTDPQAYYGLGRARLALGDGQGAVYALSMAVALVPRSADCHAYLGRAYMAMGKWKNAEKSFREALGINNKHNVAQQGLEELSNRGKALPDKFVKNQPQAESTKTSVASAKTTSKSKGRRMKPVSARHSGDMNTDINTLMDDLFAGEGQEDMGGTESSPALPMGASTGDNGLPESPSREEITKVMNGLKETIRLCIPEYKGVVAINLVIKGDSGQVSKADLEGELAESSEAICVSEVVHLAEFSRFKRKEITIRYPFKF